MIYDMECNSCACHSTVVCKISDHETVVKPGIPCRCGGTSFQIFLVPPRNTFMREPFPKGDPGWEHVTDEPTFIRDKGHLRGLCEENGSVSRYLEDDM